ncbi:zn2cys6 transcriptional regulator [Fusarium flagelliforme]|uniref:Zn2cys6 transcriptional regulator n=1 Tax=Fusarium flagelliforme TaxID=2675880 RepID=A0A395M5N0_9HYPO|nr:zn2cys6 transcriptional regulator [Fusarium flagelliforme]
MRQLYKTEKELFELLRVLPEQDAAAILLRIRAGTDAASILSRVKDGHLLMQLSLTGETRRRRYEFPYVSDIPIHLQMVDNPYLDSILCQATLLPQTVGNRALGEDGQNRELNYNFNSQPQSSNENNQQPVTRETQFATTYSVPYHAARMVEPIVDKLEAKPWTQVIADNQLFRKLICSYFLYPHPCGPFVQKDLFLEDMEAGRTDFCSPLLVNAVLSIAAQSCLEIPNRSKIWLPESLTYKFLAEARRLWDLASMKKASIPTIQAALILSYTMANNGMDEVGSLYAKRACEMGKELDLFGPDKYNTNLDKARVFTAWSIFSWQANFDFAFFRSPYLQYPPQIPLPDATGEPLWYGEVWVQYPEDPIKYPLHVGSKLEAETSFNMIRNEMGARLYGVYGTASANILTFDDITCFKNMLDDWRDKLPEVLQPRKLAFPLHLTLHVTYHQLVISFTQLIVNSYGMNNSEILKLYGGKTIETVMNEAKVMLETVVRLYYARHNFEFYDPWMAFALTVLGNIIIADLANISTTDPRIASGYRSSLILAAQGLNKQGLNFHVSRLLAVQLQGAMDPMDLQLVQTHATAACIEEDEMALIVEQSHSLWPVPGMTGINEDPDKTRLKNLIVGVDSLEL